MRTLPYTHQYGYSELQIPDIGFPECNIQEQVLEQQARPSVEWVTQGVSHSYEIEESASCPVKSEAQVSTRVKCRL